MPRDPNRNSKSRVYKKIWYGTSAIKKAAIKKANEASVRARELRGDQEMRENEAVEDLITPNEVIETELRTRTKCVIGFKKQELRRKMTELSRSEIW
jgi:hypothetical protein